MWPTMRPSVSATSDSARSPSRRSASTMSASVPSLCGWVAERRLGHRADRGFVARPLGRMARSRQQVPGAVALGGEIAGVVRVGRQAGAAPARRPSRPPLRARRPWPGCWSSAGSRARPSSSSIRAATGKSRASVGQAEPAVGVERVEALVLQAIGAQLVDQADAAPFLAQVQQHAPAARAAPRRPSRPARRRAAARSRTCRLPSMSPVRHSECSRTSGARSPSARADDQRDVLAHVVGARKATISASSPARDRQPGAGGDGQARRVAPGGEVGRGDTAAPRPPASGSTRNAGRIPASRASSSAAAAAVGPVERARPGTAPSSDSARSSAGSASGARERRGRTARPPRISTGACGHRPPRAGWRA